jgi:uncharacterized OB-fold protein
MDETRTTKALPIDTFQLVVDAWTKPFWDAAARHELVALRCGACGAFRMPPTPFCPSCRSQAAEWPELSGHGTIYSYTIVDRAVVPRLMDYLPYAPALIELNGAPGVRLVSNVVGAPVSKLAVGLPVTVAWSDREDGVSVPYFVLE